MDGLTLPWIRERAELLHRLFTRVDERRQQGLSLDKALQRRWHGKRYHTAHKVKVRLGKARLRALYYVWSRGGNTPRCLRLLFASKLPALPPGTVRAFVEACSTAGVTSFSQAARLTDTNGLPFRRVFSALSDRVRRIIRESFDARWQAEIEARKMIKELQEKLRRGLAVDAARSRRLRKLAGGLV